MFLLSTWVIYLPELFIYLSYLSTWVIYLPELFIYLSFYLPELFIQFSAAFSTLAFRLAAFPDSAESLKIADMVYLNLYMFATKFVVQKYVNLVGEGGGAQLKKYTTVMFTNM